MRLCIEPSSDLEPLSASRYWPDYIINTFGYDFRKGQPATKPKATLNAPRSDFLNWAKAVKVDWCCCAENVCVRTDALEGGAADSAYFVRIQGSTKIARTDEPKLKREIYHD